MSKIVLKEITRANWRTCVNLKVATSQQHFVATNAISLAQAAYEGNWRPYGIYNEAEMVGFVMFGLEEYQGQDVWDIIRIMLDEKQQGQGYAVLALQQVLALMKSDEAQATDVYISFIPDNHAARHVYGQVGFQDVGMSPNGQEILMYLDISA